jgi:hypothetical protein
MTFKKKLKDRREANQILRRRREWLIQSIRSHLLPVFFQHGFVVAPLTGGPPDPDDRKYLDIFPLGELRRARPGVGVDLIRIQFAAYRRAAFRIHAGVALSEGRMWANEFFETHARPWLRPSLRALKVEPLGVWFSLWPRSFRSAAKADYEKLVARVAGYVPEIELALREGQLGPHIRRVVFERPAHNPPRK